jgi:predicted nucleotidyltransferase
VTPRALDPTAAAVLLDGLVDGDPGALPALLERHGVQLLVLFGSTARGRRRPGSDLDLAVRFVDPVDAASRVLDLWVDMDRLLAPRCGMEVVSLNGAGEVLMQEVAIHGIVLYEREPGDWLTFRMWARKRFEDTEKYRRRRLKELREYFGVSTHAADPSG